MLAAFPLARAAVVGAILATALALAGCSKDDAAAAKVASAALKHQVTLALDTHAELLAQALVEERETDDQIVAAHVSRALASPNRTSWTPDQEEIRGRFASEDARSRVRAQFSAQVRPILEVITGLESSAADFEAAWPFGAEHFVCLKQGVFELTRNLRTVAVSFDRDARQSYVRLRVPSQLALDAYESAVRQGNGVAAAARLLAFRELLRTEEKKNEQVQAAYVQAATASANFYQAIESVENVSLIEVLTIVQRYAPMLSRFDDTLDGDAIARRAGVTLGKVDKSEWLKRFASDPLPGITVQCKKAT